MDEFNKGPEGFSSHDEIVTNGHYKKLAMVFILIDISNLSQDEEYLNKVNGVLKNLVDKLKEAQLCCKDNIEFKISIMTVANHSRWLVSPTLISDYTFTEITGVDGPTSADNTFEELNNKLSQREYLRYPGKIRSPMIILLSNKFCDTYDAYQESMTNLLANGWFVNSRRYAVIFEKEESEYTQNYFLSRFVSDENEGILGISDLSNIDFIPKTLHTISAGDNHSNSMLMFQAFEEVSVPLSTDELKEWEDFSSALNWHKLAAAEARRKLRERLLDGDLKEDERGHIAPSYNNILMNDDVAAKERRKLREALLRGDDNNIITPSGNATQHKDSISPDVNNPTYIQIPKGKLAGGIESERCIKCGAIIWRGNKYCSECGTKQFWHAESDFNISRVNFSATAPRKLFREVFNIIHLIVYEDEYRSIVNGIIHDKEIPQREIPGGTAELKDDSVVKIVLKSPDFELYYEEERVWKRKYIDFAIPIMLPAELRKKQIMFQAMIYINNVIATRLSFVVKCNSFRTQKISISREDILSAFISYASQDRSKVALIIQGMRKARPDMDIFFDVETLRSGEKWEDAIHQEIGNRDILYLFWSSYAKKSKWVDTEWRYAYSINGEDGIEPMPLEPAWSCPPPDELKNMHFNDNLLYIINQDISFSRAMPNEGGVQSGDNSSIDKEYLLAKMSELKELLDAGLYTQEEFEMDRKALLEEYRKQQVFLDRIVSG